MLLDSLVGLFNARLRAAVVPAPVPVSATETGLLLALLAMVSAPLRVPDAVGVKVTLTVQEPSAAMDEPQLLV